MRTNLQIFKQRGFAIVDVIVAIVLTAAVVGTGLAYIYKTNPQSITATTNYVSLAQEVGAHLKTCLLTVAHNDTPLIPPTCQEVFDCWDSHMPGGTANQWTFGPLPPGWSLSSLLVSGGGGIILNAPEIGEEPLVVCANP
jgi:hypothetical protein